MLPIPAPVSAELAVKMQSVSVGLLDELCIPPPRERAAFPLIVQLDRIGLLLSLDIPPPCFAQFPLKVQLANIGRLLLRLHIPPPEPAYGCTYQYAELARNVQFLTVGLPASLYIPAPQTK